MLVPEGRSVDSQRNIIGQDPPLYSANIRVMSTDQSKTREGDEIQCPFRDDWHNPCTYLNHSFLINIFSKDPVSAH